MTDSGVDVTAVLFDLDETLCEFTQSSTAVLVDAFDAVGVAPFFSLEQYHQRYDSYLDQSEDVEHLREQCFADIADEQGHDRALGHSVATKYSSLRDYSVRFRPGGRQVLTELAGDYMLGIVTNGSPEIQEPKLESLDLLGRFDVIVYAGYETPAKPDPAPFQRAVETLNVPPSAAVHIGDSLTSDVAGAHTAGLSTVWLSSETATHPDVPSPDHTITSLMDLETPPWTTDT